VHNFRVFFKLFIRFFYFQVLPNLKIFGNNVLGVLRSENLKFPETDILVCAVFLIHCTFVLFMPQLGYTLCLKKRDKRPHLYFE